MSVLKNRFLKERRQKRLRYNLRKKSGRIRLSIFRSHQHIYAQLIDDTKGITLASASTLDKGAAKDLSSASSPIDKARIVGKLIASRGKDKKVKQVVFDRGSFLYHGRVKALAEAARENGLDF